MEVLTDILRSMRVEGSVYFCDHLQAPWSMPFVDTDTARFHLVRRGACWLTTEDRTERLSSGDLVFIEPGLNHVLASDPPEGVKSAAGESTLLLCGYCNLANDTGTPLLSVLPGLTVVREEELLKHQWLKSTLDQLSKEYLSQQPGSELIINKLTEIVLVELIRINFGRSEKNTFIAALSDKRIAKALHLLHNNIDKPWTLELTGKNVGMSRAAFATRFKALVGLAFFKYLTQLRIQRAKEFLQVVPSIPLYEVASRVGYESDLAFTKVFKKHAGMTPTQYRRRTD